MTVRLGEQCRISVHGPRGRADLAVPMGVPLANLLPVLLKHTGGREDQGDQWILQRLGGSPLDPVGTPESMDWKEGEEFYLRSHQDPLPELDFDDIADGMASAVSRQPGRWLPEYNRWLFLGFAIFALVVLARALLYPGALGVSVVGSAMAAVALLVSSVWCGAVSKDRALILLLGLGGCGFAFLTAVLGTSGVAALFAFSDKSIFLGCLTFTSAGIVLLAGRAAWAPQVPFVPFGTVVAVGTDGLVTTSLQTGVGLSAVQATALVTSCLIGFLVFAPRIGIRFARIRGPQLPRTAEDLCYDTTPAPAERMVDQTAYADGYLTIASISSAVVLVCTFPVLTAAGTFPLILVLLVAAATLMRARGLFAAWQRVPLALAGSTGLVLALLAVISPLDAAWRGVSGIALATVFLLLVAGMLRPPPRRLLPIWGHLANWLETLSAVAIVPVLLELFGVYAWASGLTR